MIRFPLRRLPLLAGLLALLCGAAQAAGLTASVDRSSLNLGEIVELSLESSAPTLEGRPDLTPLAAQFEILDTRLLSRQVLQTARRSATTGWSSPCSRGWPDA